MKYEIIGEPMPVVVCDLEANEAMITERGSMVWMSPNMKMETAPAVLAKPSAACSPVSRCFKILIPPRAELG